MFHPALIDLHTSLRIEDTTDELNILSPSDTVICPEEIAWICRILWILRKSRK
jgi:hypothetical protein